MEVYRKAAPVKMSEDAEATTFLEEAKSFSNVSVCRADCSLDSEENERNRPLRTEGPFGRSHRERTDRRRAERKERSTCEVVLSRFYPEEKLENGDVALRCREMNERVEIVDRQFAVS